MTKLIDALMVLVAILILLGAGFGIFYGVPAVYVLSGVCIALAMFWIRRSHKIIYGAIEVVAGVLALYGTALVGKGPFDRGFSGDFYRFDWTIVLIATLTGIYIIVRGLDNIEQGLKVRYPNLWV